MNIPTLEKNSFKWHLQHLLDFTDHVLPLGEQGSYPTYNSEWLNDTEETLIALASSVQDEVDVQVIQAIGSNLTEIFREEKEPLELLKQNDMLTRLYVEGMGFGECNAHITSMATQIAHRYPKMKILEIGAGTGATTRAMARAIGGSLPRVLLHRHICWILRAIKTHSGFGQSHLTKSLTLKKIHSSKATSHIHSI